MIGTRLPDNTACRNKKSTIRDDSTIIFWLLRVSCFSDGDRGSGTCHNISASPYISDPPSAEFVVVAFIPMFLEIKVIPNLSNIGSIIMLNSMIDDC